MGARRIIRRTVDAAIVAWHRAVGPPRILNYRSELNARLLRAFGATVGSNVLILAPITLHRTGVPDYRNLSISDNCLLNGNNFIDVSAPLTLERGASIGPGTTIMTHNGYNSNEFLSDRLPHTVGFRGVIVREGACIKAHALVVMGVEIGREAVVAGGSVVNSDVPARHLVAGVPARVVTEIA